MAIKERKQITGTEAQIKGFAGHKGVLAYATDTKHLHVLSGTAGTTTKLANVSDIPAPVDISGKADTTYVNAELAKKQNKGDYATTSALTSGLAGKANSSHTHTSANVTDLNVTIGNALKPYATTNTVSTELAKKANKSHTHTVSQITDMPNVVLSVNNITPASGGNVNLGLHAVATSGDYNDLRNKPSMPVTPQAYITETWRDGSNWYRKWSDGFIEQGGTHYDYSHDITFNTPFSNTNYAISGWAGRTSSDTLYPVMTVVITVRAAASFSCWIGYTRSDNYTKTVKERATIYWSAVGY